MKLIDKCYYAESACEGRRISYVNRDRLDIHGQSNEIAFLKILEMTRQGDFGVILIK